MVWPLGDVSANADPVPARFSVCGLPAALSVIVSTADKLPPVVGVNVIGILQLASAARLFPQLLLPAVKSAAFVPLIEIEVILTAAVPVFVTVTGSGVLTVTGSGGNARVLGDNVIVGLELLDEANRASTLRVICCAAALTVPPGGGDVSCALDQPSSPQLHVIVPAANTVAPLGAV